MYRPRDWPGAVNSAQTFGGQAEYAHSTPSGKRTRMVSVSAMYASATIRFDPGTGMPFDHGSQLIGAPPCYQRRRDVRGSRLGTPRLE